MSNIAFFFNEGVDPTSRQAFLDAVKESYPRAQNFISGTEDGSAATFYVQYVQGGAGMPSQPPSLGKFHIVVSSNHQGVLDWNLKYKYLRTMAVKLTEDNQRSFRGKAGVNQGEFKQAMDQLLRTTEPLYAVYDDLIRLNHHLRVQGLDNPERFLSRVSGYQQIYSERSTDFELVFSDTTPRVEELRGQFPAVVPSYRNIDVVAVMDEQALARIDDNGERPVIVLVWSPPGNKELMKQARELAIRWTDTRRAPSAFVYSFNEYDSGSPPSVEALMTMVREGMDQLNNRSAMLQWSIYYHPEGVIPAQFEHIVTNLQKRRATMNVTAASMINQLMMTESAEEK
jgi:hypothetical protein